jgi:hypothetical protein
MNKFYELFFGSPTLHRSTAWILKWSATMAVVKHFVNIYGPVEMGLELKDDQCNPGDPEICVVASTMTMHVRESECIPVLRDFPSCA